MLFIKPILLLSAVAVVLAITVNLVCVVIGRITGTWTGDFATRPGWVVIFATLWALAFVIGIVVARIFHLFPFLPVKR